MRRKEKISKYKMIEFKRRIEQAIILEELVKKYGDKQITICIEEMAELTKELCKNIRGHCNLDKIYEEMADVYIMLMQMQMLFKIDYEILDAMIENKIQRTKERLLDI